MVSFVLCSVCSFFKCFKFNTSVCPIILLFNLVTELPSVSERAANSANHLLFRCLLRYVCSSFPLMLRISFEF